MLELESVPTERRYETRSRTDKFTIRIVNAHTDAHLAEEIELLENTKKSINVANGRNTVRISSYVDNGMSNNSYDMISRMHRSDKFNMLQNTITECVQHMAEAVTPPVSTLHFQDNLHKQLHMKFRELDDDTPEHSQETNVVLYVKALNIQKEESSILNDVVDCSLRIGGAVLLMGFGAVALLLYIVMNIYR